MSYSHYERLTALDASFLALEDENVHMHVGSVSVFDAGELVDAEGGLDFERIRGLAEWALRRGPRFRQHLARVPLLGEPVWVDDAHFNLDYHVRHTSLPAPGDERQLKRLAGRIMSQRLDRGKPLWEMWFVEGLEQRRFAVIAKIHHCMIDGVSATDLMGAFMGPDPHHRPEPVQSCWLPRPLPGGATLLRHELLRRAGQPLRALELVARALRDPASALHDLAAGLEGMRSAFSSGLTPASPTPLNQPIGPHRRFDWTRMDLAAVREVKGRHGGTLNDVALATVTATLRRFLLQRGHDVDRMTLRALVPVSVRREQERGKLGNRVAFLSVPLPVDEADPVRRLRRVAQTTRALKSSHQVMGVEWLEALSDGVATGLMGSLARLASRTHPYNVVVTNVPGPEKPAYLLGSRMLATHPLVPLFADQVLGIALVSYAGSLHWGFNADWESLPELHELVEAVALEFEALRKA